MTKIIKTQFKAYRKHIEKDRIQNMNVEVLVKPIRICISNRRRYDEMYYCFPVLNQRIITTIYSYNEYANIVRIQPINRLKFFIKREVFFGRKII